MRPRGCRAGWAAEAARAAARPGACRGPAVPSHPARRPGPGGRRRRRSSQSKPTKHPCTRPTASSAPYNFHGSWAGRRMRGPAPSQEKRQLLSVDVVGEASSAVPAPGAPDPHATIPLVGPFAGHLHFDASITPVLRTDVDVDAYVRRGTSRLGVDTALL